MALQQALIVPSGVEARNGHVHQPREVRRAGPDTEPPRPGRVGYFGPSRHSNGPLEEIKGRPEGPRSSALGFCDPRTTPRTVCSNSEASETGYSSDAMSHVRTGRRPWAVVPRRAGAVAPKLSRSRNQRLSRFILRANRTVKNPERHNAHTQANGRPEKALCPVANEKITHRTIKSLTKKPISGTHFSAFTSNTSDYL